MKEIPIVKIENGYNSAFIDSSVQADPSFSPQFLTNNGSTVFSSLKKELNDCKELKISVAFITMGGLTPLLGTLKELEKKDIKGQIITTDYLLFSEPKALDRLNELKNIKLKIFKTSNEKIGFHTKGYIFKNDVGYHVVVGSSNLTHNAIFINHEWNTRIVSTPEGKFAQDVISEFNTLWDNSVSYSDYRDEYYELYKKSDQSAVRIVYRSIDLEYSQVLQPNMMQQRFVENIFNIVNSKANRALLISATGTGKTYASAFAVRKLFSEGIIENQKVLFIS
ncbi:MAG: DEAD/DEAH box helicase family protein, partial [Alistipes sp.]|nr:DEAD/DEAH box helicase family protein [Candidatus Alistipes equi]